MASRRLVMATSAGVSVSGVREVEVLNPEVIWQPGCGINSSGIYDSLYEAITAAGRGSLPATILVSFRFAGDISPFEIEIAAGVYNLENITLKLYESVQVAGEGGPNRYLIHVRDGAVLLDLVAVEGQMILVFESDTQDSLVYSFNVNRYSTLRLRDGAGLSNAGAAHAALTLVDDNYLQIEAEYAVLGIGNNPVIAAASTGIGSVKLFVIALGSTFTDSFITDLGVPGYLSGMVFYDSACNVPTGLPSSLTISYMELPVDSVARGNASNALSGLGYVMGQFVDLSAQAVADYTYDLSLSGLPTIYGVEVPDNKPFLLVGQDDSVLNGLYIAHTDGVPTRSPYMAGVGQGMRIIKVRHGPSSFGSTNWQVTEGGNAGVDELTITQMKGGGSAGLLSIDVATKAEYSSTTYEEAGLFQFDPTNYSAGAKVVKLVLIFDAPDGGTLGIRLWDLDFITGGSSQHVVADTEVTFPVPGCVTLEIAALEAATTAGRIRLDVKSDANDHLMQLHSAKMNVTIVPVEVTGVPAGTDIDSTGHVFHIDPAILPAASTSVAGIIKIGTTAGTALDGGTTIVDATARAIINGVVGYQVKAMSVTNLTLSGAQTIDGVSCVAGDVVGALGQNDLTTAGPWVVGASGWTRPAWFPAAAHAFGVKLTVQYGSTYGGTQWTCITAASDIIGTDKLVWSGNQAVLPSQVDGSTLYLWQCAELGGSVLYDSGPQAAHITLAGTPNTDWVRARASTPKQYQLHNLDPSGIQPAVFNLPVAVPGASSFTVEMTLNMAPDPRGNQMCLFLSNSQTAGCDAVGSFDFGGVWYCGAGYGGAFANGYTTTTIRGTVCHLGLTWTDGVGLDFYVNGQHIFDNIIGHHSLSYAGSLAAMNWIGIGGDTRSSGGLDSMRGYISNCRISSVVRDLAWMQRQYQYALWG